MGAKPPDFDSLAIATPRLLLVPSTPSLLNLELIDKAAFSALLGASLPEDWPPGDYDRDAAQFFLEKLVQGGTAVAGWYGWYVIQPATLSGPAVLIGNGGYLGPPDEAGSVEIGYSVCGRWRGQGLAKELVAALVDNAIRRGARKIVAHTSPENTASVGVLTSCGFLPVVSPDPLLLQFEYSPS